MLLGDRKTAVLRGGAPWGFRLSGGVQAPVYITKVRSRSKAALGGLAAGDTVVSVNGISSLQKTLREINEAIDSVRDQLVLEVQSSSHPRVHRLDSSSSLDTTDNSPVRSIHQITPQTENMDYYSYNSSRPTPNYPSYTSTSGFNSYDNSNGMDRDQRYTDSYGRSIPNPLPAMFRTATVTSNAPSTPSASSRAQQFSYRPATSHSTYDTQRNYGGGMNTGYISDSYDHRRSNVPTRPNISNNQPPSYNPQPQYNTRLPTALASNDQNYYSDSECVTAGPRYYKISRQSNTPRRPSNVVLPIRSMTSKAYDQYVPPESPKAPQQQPVDVYRYQQEQQRLERERQMQQQEQQRLERERQMYQQQQAAAARFKLPPHITMPSQDPRRRSDGAIDRELGAELLKSPIANKKVYGDSSFFKTPFNTYPTIEEQKKMARQIASILEGGDPTQKGATKFEKQRQRAEKYTLEASAGEPTLNTSNYRPLRQLQTNDGHYSNNHNSPEIPACIKNSLEAAQYMNPLRYVGAPEDFKQIHMQEHVTHTNVPPQAAMSLVADLNQNRGKGAALFQKRKARSEKWVIDENNVKKSGYQATSSYIDPTTKPWGRHAPASWSGDESPYSGPSYSPVKPKFNPPPPSTVPEPVFSPAPTQNVTKYGDFNAKPKGFGSWNAETSKSPRTSVDLRKPLNLQMGPGIRQGMAESYGKPASQPWSPSSNNQAMFSPTQPLTNDYFNYPSDNILSKWKNQDYTPWNQQTNQEQHQTQIPMTREGVDTLRQRLTQQNPSQLDQQYKQYATAYNQRPGNNMYSPSQGPSASTQKHFTDL